MRALLPSQSCWPSPAVPISPNPNGIIQPKFLTIHVVPFVACSFSRSYSFPSPFVPKGTLGATRAGSLTEEFLRDFRPGIRKHLPQSAPRNLLQALRAFRAELFHEYLLIVFVEFLVLLALLNRVGNALFFRTWLLRILLTVVHQLLDELELVPICGWPLLISTIPLSRRQDHLLLYTCSSIFPLQFFITSVVCVNFNCPTQNLCFLHPDSCVCSFSSPSTPMSKTILNFPSAGNEI